eukprot:39813-Chlamydomonas_euryale.AAC.2
MLASKRALPSFVLNLPSARTKAGVGSGLRAPMSTDREPGCAPSGGLAGLCAGASAAAASAAAASGGDGVGCGAAGTDVRLSDSLQTPLAASSAGDLYKTWTWRTKLGERRCRWDQGTRRRTLIGFAPRCIYTHRRRRAAAACVAMRARPVASVRTRRRGGGPHAWAFRGRGATLARAHACTTRVRPEGHGSNLGMSEAPQAWRDIPPIKQIQRALLQTMAYHTSTSMTVRFRDTGTCIR